MKIYIKYYLFISSIIQAWPLDGMITPLNSVLVQTKDGASISLNTTYINHFVAIKQQLESSIFDTSLKFIFLDTVNKKNLNNLLRVIDSNDSLKPLLENFSVADKAGLLHAADCLGYEEKEKLNEIHVALINQCHQAQNGFQALENMYALQEINFIYGQSAEPAALFDQLLLTSCLQYRLGRDNSFSIKNPINHSSFKLNSSSNEAITVKKLFLNDEASLLAFICDDNLVRIRSAEGDYVQDFKMGWVTSVAFSHDNKYLALGGRSFDVLLWNLKETSLHPIKNGNEKIPYVNPTIEVFSDSGHSLGLRRIESSEAALRLNSYYLWGHEEDIKELCFSPDGTKLAVLTDELAIWSVKDKMLLHTVGAYSISPGFISFSSNNELLFMDNSIERGIKKLNLQSQKIENMQPKKLKNLSALALSVESQILAFQNDNTHQIHVMRLQREKPTEYHSLDCDEEVSDMKYTLDGSKLVYAIDSKVTIVDLLPSRNAIKNLPWIQKLAAWYALKGLIKIPAKENIKPSDILHLFLADQFDSLPEYLNDVIKNSC